MPADKILQFYSRLAQEQGGAGLTVTLSVGGMLISGQIITASLYLTLLRSINPGDHPPSEIEAYEQGLQSLSDETEFIHLRNASIYLPNGQRLPTQGAITWRGQLTAVDGFFIGLLSA